MIFYVKGTLVEFKRDLIWERTNAGLAAAQVRGRRGSRPHKLKKSGKAALARAYLPTGIIQLRKFVR